MSTHFADRLIAAIDDKGSAVCVGIDPIYESLPEAVAGPASQRNANDAEAALDAIYEFVTGVLEVLAPIVPIVKFQSAYFEKYLWEGVQAYYDLIQEAHELGLLVIGDVKRGDIGSTASAYAAGHLADPGYIDLEDVVTPDAITVNPMLGLDTLEPFIETARDSDKGLFVLVRTSNPGSGDFQDVKLEDGRTWSEMLADKLAPVAERLIGSSGYSAVGAVVGATQPHTMVSLRRRLPRSIMLLPGYGAQGATADMTRSAFDKHGHGALVSASRSILYAHKEKKHADLEWQDAVRKATLDMTLDIARVLGKQPA